MSNQFDHFPGCQLDYVILLYSTASVAQATSRSDSGFQILIGLFSSWLTGCRFQHSGCGRRLFVHTSIRRFCGVWFHVPAPASFAWKSHILFCSPRGNYRRLSVSVSSINSHEDSRFIPKRYSTIPVHILISFNERPNFHRHCMCRVLCCKTPHGRRMKGTGVAVGFWSSLVIL